MPKCSNWNCGHTFDHVLKGRVWMTDISIGVIGAGGMGMRHAVNLLRSVKGARVAAIYDLDQARAGQVAAVCCYAREYPAPGQLILDTGLVAVYIVSTEPSRL